MLKLGAFLFLAGYASAHAIFQELYVNGASQGHLVGIRVPDYDGPIMDVNSNDIICNGGINPYHQPVSQTVIKVPAGAQLTAEWHHTLNGATPGDAADPIDASHKGPLIVYLAQVGSATQTSVTGLKWFKIYEDGLSGGTWGVDRLVANKGKMSFTIPSCIPAGQYLLRVEIIALHGASSYPGAQFYMECAQLEITGGGNTSPANIVSFPGAYKGSDPGITINIYQNLQSYKIPGPSVFSCSGNNTPVTTGGGSSPNPTTSAPSTPTTSAPSSGTVAQWGQCGGIGYNGPTTCVSPYKCVKSNDYYSQCQ
ncbi:endoglucanase ii [Moniliophthora roreri MCA 2997]|uniref:AA9 family lytic polysaccharide monooxygenase n=1 Tax=Moniliophthora roreri (strain MCA 2997) TaxID=1381753 RepID=V2YVQ3_MONRO|nr:endoglucanase ii [Moniliophthora roreri MCA 2997]KAI3616081.1 endoglucanase ii [Moniliophthora roreri]